MRVGDFAVAAPVLRTAFDEAERLRGFFSVALLDDWVAGAQPGARIVYAIGAHAATDAAPGVAARVWELGQHGLVHPLPVRRGDDDRRMGLGFDYTVRRLGCELPAGFPVLPPLVARPVARRVGVTGK